MRGQGAGRRHLDDQDRRRVRRRWRRNRSGSASPVASAPPPGRSRSIARRYGSASTVQMKVTDTNAGPTVNVTLSSPTEPTGETATLTGANGIFTGSIPLSPYSGGVSDGTLQVSHNDLITATYNDASPACHDHRDRQGGHQSAADHQRQRDQPGQRLGARDLDHRRQRLLASGVRHRHTQPDDGARFDRRAQPPGADPGFDGETRPTSTTPCRATFAATSRATTTAGSTIASRCSRRATCC